MSNKITTTSDSIEISEEILNEILQKIDTLALDLATQVEEKDNWNYFGIAKYNKDVEKSEKIFENLTIPEDEKKLFKIIVKAHDIWRHQEVLWSLDTLRKWERHWIISSELLKNNNSLKWLEEEQKEIIYNAIKFHSEKEVDLDKGSIEHKLCYILRDYDKKEIIDNDKFLSDEGVFWELKKHYFWDNLNKDYSSIVSKLIKNPEFTNNNFNKTELQLKDYLSLWIEESAFNDFKECKTINVSDIKYSYSTYMLMSIAMIFDISNDDVLVETINTPMFKKRFDFIEKRVNKEEFQTIITTTKTYLENRIKEKTDINEYIKTILNF